MVTGTFTYLTVGNIYLINFNEMTISEIECIAVPLFQFDEVLCSTLCCSIIKKLFLENFLFLI